MKIHLGIALAASTLLCVSAHALPAPNTTSAATQSAFLADVLPSSMRLQDSLWDEQAHLLRYPTNQPAPAHPATHMVRESTWYAVGLLHRDAPGDCARAAVALRAVLAQQYTDSAQPWFGTFRRSPEEPAPLGRNGVWHSYDPNWRQFIGTTFAVILIEYADRIPADLAEQLKAAIGRAAQGEIKDGRLKPSYSNIALMQGFLLDYAASSLRHTEWAAQAESWNQRVYGLFQEHNAFSEYNSPTYYGVDLFGLALLRKYGSNASTRAMGADMEARLWGDVADFYHPRLHNIAGPFDRAYGMDMESYVSLMGMWMSTVLAAGDAPLPRITTATDHVADICFAPLMAVAQTRVPDDVAVVLRSEPRAHLAQHRIDDKRVATAWIGRNLILGGEATGKTRTTGPHSQFHPATIQWRTPTGKIGWVNVVEAAELDASADEKGLLLSARDSVRIRLHADGLQASQLTKDAWNLPGLMLSIKTDAKSFTVISSGENIDLIYGKLSTLRVETQTPSNDAPVSVAHGK